MTKPKQAAKGRRPKKEGQQRSITQAFTFSDGITRVPLADVRLAEARQYRAMAASGDPDLQARGAAALKRLDAQIAGERVVALAVAEHFERSAQNRKSAQAARKGSPEQLAEFAKEKGYPDRCSRKMFVIDAMKRFKCSDRQVDRWMRAAKEKNLLT